MAMPMNKSIEIYLLHEIEMRGGSVRARDPAIYDAVAGHFPLLTEDDRKLVNVATGENKWKNRVDWVRYRLVREGELDGSQRGIWRITQRGRDRLQNEWPPREPPRYSEKLYTDGPRYKKSPASAVLAPAQRPVTPVSPTPQPAPTPVATPPRAEPPARASLLELIRAHLEEVKRRLAQRIADLSADQFEQFVAEFLTRQGYSDVRRTGGPGDRNVDVTATYGAPFVEVPLRVQVKHRQRGGTVGPSDVAAFRDRAGGVDRVLLMVTNERLGPAALDTASEQGRQRVHVVQGDDLLDAMIDKRIAVKEGPLGLLEIDEKFFAQF